MSARATGRSCRSRTAPGRAVAAMVLLWGAACSGPQPFLLQGDASSAEIGYSGDVAGAMPVARRHCAQFERVPHLLEAQQNIAFFDCVKPQ